ncbi:MAG TPA: G/U mismatch-specific DNA glycosylase [Tepidisphaeraceae bacterium]|nr:G/U mismatch-specific DNA glycosylase [Tepidisphaeraceae bacterium]
MPLPWKPTKAQLLSAHTKTVPDLIRPNLDVLFVGINPGLYTAAVGHHFARPGNRFWPAMHKGGFTPHRFSPFDSAQLLDLNLGITNMCPRPTAMAHQLSTHELRAGARALTRKVLRHTPRFIAVIGITSYRIAFNRKEAVLGLQNQTIGDTRIWVLPNPSGLNAHYQVSDLAKLFRMLKNAVSNASKI